MSTAELPIKDRNIAKAFSPAAKLVVDKWAALRNYLDSSLEEDAFLSSVVMELNVVEDGCDPTSICKSVANLAYMGLMPGAAMQLAYFCPRKDTKGNKKNLQVELMYQGILSLAYENGFLRDVHCDVVLQGEQCDRENRETGPYIRHILPNEREMKWDNVVGSYCIWHGTKGGFGIKWTGKSELAAIKSKAGATSVWNYPNAVIAMCEKTPLKRAAKFWPKTRKISLANSLEDSLDTDREQLSVFQQSGQEPIDLSSMD